MIAIFDYGAGNLRSVANTLDEIGATYRIVQTAGELREAGKVILPGVGHFGQMMRQLDRMGVREALGDVIRAGRPFLGICLGLQALFEESEEAPGARGLGVIAGKVRRFAPPARVPEMGWNSIVLRRPCPLLAGLAERPYLYFAHSYYCPEGEYAAAVCSYAGVNYTAVLEAGVLFGVQFHPEKSGPLGLRIMRNFVEL